VCLSPEYQNIRYSDEVSLLGKNLMDDAGVLLVNLIFIATRQSFALVGTPWLIAIYSIAVSLLLAV